MSFSSPAVPLSPQPVLRPTGRKPNTFYPALTQTSVDLTHWHVVEQKEKPETELDYIAMNRTAAKKGLVSPKEMKDFRTQNPVHIKSGAPSVTYRKSNMNLPSDSDNSFTYGKPTRCSTPVSLLMTDTPQREWLAAQAKREADAERKLAAERARAANRRLKEKRSSSVNNGKNQSSTTPDGRFNVGFKLSKFEKVGCRVDSRREPPRQYAAEATEKE